MSNIENVNYCFKEILDVEFVDWRKAFVGKK